MARPNYRDSGRTPATKSGGPIGWLQSMWGKRLPGYRSQNRGKSAEQGNGMFGRTRPDYRRPDGCPPEPEQCCYAQCGPCKTFPTGSLTPSATDPTTLQGPVTIIVNGQE
jgi:hypothetical protein